MRRPYRGKIKGCSHVVLVFLDLLPEAHRLIVLQRVDVLKISHHLALNTPMDRHYKQLLNVADEPGMQP
jgi:hypothetical protein